MGKNNVGLYNLAEKHLGDGGAKYRKYCGLPAGSAWCCAFVTYVFAEGNDSALFFNGRKVVYCPTAQAWCRKNLANIPVYLALPMDIVFFDWELNGVPNHIGFAHDHKSDQVLLTLEGNTAGGVVAKRSRNAKYICGCYRPNFKASYKIGMLKVDGHFGYNSIAMLQTVLDIKVDGILGLETVKAIQRLCGVKQDGDWSTKTSKALQKKIGVTADGYFGPESVKALQKWINKLYKASLRTVGDDIADTAKKYIGKVPYVKGGTNINKGVDCTGFVQECYRLNGIKLDNKLSDWGKSIGTDVSKAKPGDIFTYKNSSGIHHGIYVGNKYIVHAANTKSGVIKSRYDSVSKPLVGIRRRWK